MKREGQPQAIYETAIKLAIEVVKTEKVSSETDDGDVAYNLALDHAVESLSKLIFAVPPAVAGDEPLRNAAQEWCDHCSADLNGVQHILCERCYREYAGPKWWDADFNPDALKKENP